MSFWSIASIILLVAKLAGYFPYSWLWVFAPMAVGLVLGCVLAVLMLIAAVTK